MREVGEERLELKIEQMMTAFSLSPLRTDYSGSCGFEFDFKRFNIFCLTAFQGLSAYGFLNLRTASVKQQR